MSSYRTQRISRLDSNSVQAHRFVMITFQTVCTGCVYFVYHHQHWNNRELVSNVFPLAAAMYTVQDMITLSINKSKKDRLSSYFWMEFGMIYCAPVLLHGLGWNFKFIKNEWYYKWINNCIMAVNIGLLLFKYKKLFNLTLGIISSNNNEQQNTIDYNEYSKSLKKSLIANNKRNKKSNNYNKYNSDINNIYLENTLIIMNKKNIKHIKMFLIGMMGTGKTTLAKYIGNNILKCNVYDTDRLIESVLKQNIPQIYQDYGEECFRKLETLTLNQLCTMKKLENNSKSRSNRNHVSCISTGGGIVSRQDNWSLMKNKINENENENAVFVTIFIDTNINVLYNRVNTSIDKYPMLTNSNSENVKERFEQLLNKRRKMYEKADVIIKVESSEQDVCQVSQNICSSLLNYLETLN